MQIEETNLMNIQCNNNNSTLNVDAIAEASPIELSILFEENQANAIKVSGSCKKKSVDKVNNKNKYAHNSTGNVKTKVGLLQRRTSNKVKHEKRGCEDNSVEIMPFSKNVKKDSNRLATDMMEESTNDKHCCSETNVKKKCNEEDHASICSQYKCGVCQRNFETICVLHDHLQFHHRSGGSYHYDDIIRTAFPKYESFCRFTQTETDFCRDPEFEMEEVNSGMTGDMDATSSEVKFEPISAGQEMEYSTDEGDNIFDHHSDIIMSNEPKDTMDQNLELNQKRLMEVKSRKHVDRVIIKSSATKTTNPIKRKKMKSKTVKKVTKLTKQMIHQEKKHKKSKAGHLNVENVRSESENISIQFPDDDVLDNSQQTDHEKKGFTCELCNTSFTKNNNLLKHENVKHPDKQNINCENCDKKFIRKTDLDNHRSYAHSHVKHVKLKEESSEQSDDTVKKESDKEITLDIYVDFDETDSQTYINLDNSVDVPADKESSKKIKKESKPARKVKSKEEVQLLKMPYTCELCGHIMPRSKMEIHNRIHTGERPFECESCGKGLISADKLKRHMLTHAEVKKHTCDVCGAGFQMKYKLKMHSYIHTGKKPYLCSVCGAEFNHSSNLANHTRCVHRQVKPFECTVCKASFARRSQLDEHVFSHSSEKQFTCRYCGKSFKYLKGMRRHEKNHMEGHRTEYPCDNCDMKFYRKDTFERHKLVHTKEVLFTCFTCKTVVKDHNELAVHVQTHHEKKTFECLICGEKFMVANKYYTHMLVMHYIKKEAAKQMLTDCKDGKVSKSVADILAKNATAMLDPNLPLPADPVESVTVSTKLSHTANSGFNVNQMVSSILDENKATINALTRVATENLRLHSQDIGEEEKSVSIVPPVNPLVVFEKTSRQAPLDHLGHNIAFNISQKTSLIASTHPMEITDHAYGQTFNQNQPRDSLVNQMSIQSTSGLNNSALTHLNVSDSLGYSSSNTSVLNIGNLTSYLGGQRSHPTTLTEMSNMSHQSTGLSGIEHGAIESLRRLQDSSDPPVSNSLVPISQEGILISQGHPSNVLIAGNGMDTDNNHTVGYRIQNLY